MHDLAERGSFASEVDGDWVGNGSDIDDLASGVGTPGDVVGSLWGNDVGGTWLSDKTRNGDDVRSISGVLSAQADELIS